MSFAEVADKLHYFRDKQNITAVHEAIAGLLLPGGGTNMAVVFKDALDLFSSDEGGRSHVTRVLVLVSDGVFQSKFIHCKFKRSFLN